MLLGATLLAITACSAPIADPVGVPFRESGIYATGEPAGWTLTADSGTYAYELRENGGTVIQSGSIDFGQGPKRIEASLSHPAMLYLELKSTDGKVLAFGAAVAPTQIQPSESRPTNFDSFWAGRIAESRRIPSTPRIEAQDTYREDVAYSLVTMDHIAGTHVYGQLARPKREGKFPAMLITQWASPPYPLDKSWVTEPAHNGWLVLNIQPHDTPVAAPKSYYDGLPDRIKNYASINQEDRYSNYFVEMYLRGVRAVDYLTTRPEWDGKTILVMGTSMGGQQALAIAGLHPRVTHLIVNVPAGSDLTGPLHGRANSYPFYPPDNARAMGTARYIDANNFAPRIRARSLVGMGFIDTACAPSGIWATFNLIKGPKEAAPMPSSPHNHLATPEQQRPITEATSRWLARIVAGESVP